MYSPTPEQFQELSAKFNLIPVSRLIMADLETPVSAFIKVAKDDPHAFLLESVEQGEKLGRYSFIGFNPAHIFSFRDRQATEVHSQQHKEYTLQANEDPLSVLKRFQTQFNAYERADLPPFFGGLVGYLNYEMTQHFERLSFENRDDYNIPDSVFYYADTLIIFDHFQRTITIVANAEVRGDSAAAYQQAVERIEEVVDKLKAPLPPITFGAGQAKLSPVETNWSKEDFQEAVDRSLEYIRAGDIYQIQVGIRSSLPVKSSPLNLYRALRRINPSPYTFISGMKICVSSVVHRRS